VTGEVRGGAVLPTYDEHPAGTLPDGARRAAVLGRPIAHSLSPVLHRAAYAALGLDWVYGRAEVDEPELAGVVAALDAEWGGLSLTMPLKHVALELVDVVEPLAEVVGAVNTVIVQPGAGLLVGANTDVHGIVAALREAVGQEDWRPDGAVVLGGGATAASTLAALAELGVTDALVLVRNPARAGALLRAAHRMGVHPTVRRWTSVEQAADAACTAGVTVSTLPAHAADELGDHLAARAAGRTTGRVLLDVAYDPWPSRLAAGFAAGGGAVAPGWAMLLHQAVEQVRLMTGHPAPVDAMRSALTESLAVRGR